MWVCICVIFALTYICLLFFLYFFSWQDKLDHLGLQEVKLDDYMDEGGSLIMGLYYKYDKAHMI